MKFLTASYTSLALVLGACQCQAASKDLQISYTQLKNCKETVLNDNAAQSELKCPALGKYDVRVNQVGEEYFGISLVTGAKKITSDFDAFPSVRPVGQAIEWHSRAGAPAYMIFRISYDEGGTTKEVLVLNLVTDTAICPLASINASKNPKANEQARSLISGQFAQTQTCPASVVKL
ncbi:MAG TPA: hypothetical protein VIZ65_05515 [Cellvibrionaceae bacterium]